MKRLIFLTFNPLIEQLLRTFEVLVFCLIILLPALHVDLISAEVEIFLREDLGNLLKEFLQEGVHPLLSRVQGSVIPVLGAHAVITLRQKPRLSGLKTLRGLTR